MSKAERNARYRAKHKETIRAYNAAWRKANKEQLQSKRQKRYAENRERENERARKWRKANKERVNAYNREYRKQHPGYSTKCKRAWRAKHSDKAKIQNQRCEQRRWLRIIDSYELHEARMLQEHNRKHPTKPYCPRYKARRPPTWMMHRALWEYAGGEPTPEQKAYAVALFRKRRAQRFGEREEME